MEIMCPYCGAVIDASADDPSYIDFAGDYITAEWIVNCNCGAVLTAKCNYEWDGEIEVTD